MRVCLSFGRHLRTGHPRLFPWAVLDNTGTVLDRAQTRTAAWSRARPGQHIARRV